MRRLDYSRALPRPRAVPVCGLAVSRHAFMAERSQRARELPARECRADRERDRWEGEGSGWGDRQRDWFCARIGPLRRRVVPFT